MQVAGNRAKPHRPKLSPIVTGVRSPLWGQTSGDLLKTGNDLISLPLQSEIQVPELQLISMKETGEALKTMGQQCTTGKIVMSL